MHIVFVLYMPCWLWLFSMSRRSTFFSSVQQISPTDKQLDWSFWNSFVFSECFFIFQISHTVHLSQRSLESIWLDNCQKKIISLSFLLLKVLQPPKKKHSEWILGILSGCFFFSFLAIKIHESLDDLRELSCLEAVHGHAHVHAVGVCPNERRLFFPPWVCNRCIAELTDPNNNQHISGGRGVFFVCLQLLSIHLQVVL